MPRIKSKPKNPALTANAFTLTQADENILARLTQDARDYTGRTISGSAIIRALLRHADQQGYQWMLANICPLIETELARGVMWGKKKE